MTTALRNNGVRGGECCLSQEPAFDPMTLFTDEMLATMSPGPHWPVDKSKCATTAHQELSLVSGACVIDVLHDDCVELRGRGRGSAAAAVPVPQ